MGQSPLKVVDLFSGAGGLSYGFDRHPRFEIVEAVDAEISKPSSGRGALECNATYSANIGFEPLDLDLSDIEADTVSQFLSTYCDDVDILLAGPPCTGFTRTNPENHERDDERNSLVTVTGKYIVELEPAVALIENVRELINGNFKHHHNQLISMLQANGYETDSDIYDLQNYGLPQLRERSFIIACKEEYNLRTLRELWSGRRVDDEAITVRRAIADLPPIQPGEQHPEDDAHVAPGFNSDTVRRRIELIPDDGGSWMDIKDHPEAEKVLTKGMKRILDEGRIGSYPDIYGRLAWDEPAVTIKRECSHVGNGRYVHPEQDRLCSVRELAILQGFPRDYEFKADSRSNNYRHVGDSVPPLISHQWAHIVDWTLTGTQPEIEETILNNCHLEKEDLAENTKAGQIKIS